MRCALEKARIACFIRCAPNGTINAFICIQPLVLISFVDRIRLEFTDTARCAIPATHCSADVAWRTQLAFNRADIIIIIALITCNAFRRACDDLTRSPRTLHTRIIHTIGVCSRQTDFAFVAIGHTNTSDCTGKTSNSGIFIRISTFGAKLAISRACIIAVFSNLAYFARRCSYSITIVS